MTFSSISKVVVDDDDGDDVDGDGLVGVESISIALCCCQPPYRDWSSSKKDCNKLNRPINLVVEVSVKLRRSCSHPIEAS